MDVLYIIKEEHQTIRTLIQHLGTAKSLTEKKKYLKQLTTKAGLHLHLECDYLYPEVSNIIKDSADFIKKSTVNHKYLKKTLTDLHSLLNKKSKDDHSEINNKISVLSDRFVQHLDSEEDWLMPKIRTYIPTQDREDLGQVFIDVREDVSSSHSNPIANL